MQTSNLTNWLEKHRDIGLLLLRLFIGFRITYGVADNVFSWDHMLGFNKFLEANGFPFPLASAMLSVYAQFLAGLMIVSGYMIRLAALAMVINFLVAIIMVHLHDSVEIMTPALSMLFCNIMFLFYGGGKYAAKRS